MRIRRSHGKRITAFLENASKPSRLILHIGLPVMIAALLQYTYQFFFALQRDSLWASRYYGGMLEHLLMSLLLIVAGAIAFDLVEKFVIEKN